jgi:hypothetical protein
MIDQQWLSDRVCEHLARTPETPVKLAEIAPRAHKIRVDDACSYFFDGTDQEEWCESDFPFLIPPFDSTWLEATLPRTCVSELFKGERRQVSSAQPRSIAVLIEREDAREDGFNNIAPDFHEAHPTLPEGTRHLLLMTAFYESADFSVGYAGLRVVLVKNDGSPTWHQLTDGKVSRYTAVPPEIAERVGMEAAVEFVGWLTNPILLALSFINCRNSIIRETQATRSERRRRDRAGLPTSKYHVLEIESIRRAVSERMAATGESKAKALHFCRGHFATYGDDHPLFGKYTGRYWRPAHTRGSVQAGVVVKDYELAR